nr:hypothetical protein [Tanacetum cinerariifolium]
MQNNKDALVDGKEHDDDIQKSVSPDIHSSSCGDQTKEQGDKAENKDKVFAAAPSKSQPLITTAARTISAVKPKFSKAHLNITPYAVSKSKSPLRKPFLRHPSPKPSISPPRINVAKLIAVSAAKHNHGKKGNPQQALKDKGVIDSGCSRHMTGNMSYLSDFEELNGGYVAFGGNPKGGKITGKGKIKTGKLDFDDVYFVKELKFNLFSVSQLCDKKNNVLFTDTECLVLSSDFKLPDASQVLLRVPRENNINADLNQFCGLKGIKKEFSVPRTPQQNGIAERKNRTLIEAARTMVLVTKPHNKTPYELLHGRLPSIGFMRPFGCPVTILNTLDPLGKFQGKVDEGFLIGYSVCNKAFRVFNSRTRIVQETLHVNFMENKPNVAGFGPAWLFDIDSISQTMNYHPVLAKNQTNTNAGFQDTKKAGEEETHTYVLFSVLSDGSTNPKNNIDALVDGKEHDDDIQKYVSPDIHSLSFGDQTKEQGDKAENKGKSPVVTITGFRDLNEEFAECINNSSNEVNATGSSVYAAGLDFTNSTNDFSAAGPSNAAIPNLEDPSHNAEDVGAEADINNMESIILTRSMARGVRDQGGISQMFNEDFHTCMFACFLSQEEPKRIHQALKDPSWIEAMQEELLQFKMQKFWNTVVVKRSGDVTRLQALVDKKRTVITEEVVREILQLNDAEGVICLPNDEIFASLARMGVGKGFSGVETPLFETMLAVRDIAEEAEAQIPAQDADVQEHVTEEITNEVLATCSALVLRVEGLENVNAAQQLEIITLKARVKKLEKLNKVKSSKLRRLRKVVTSQRVESSNDVETVFNQGRISVDMETDEGVEIVVDQEKNAEVEERQADKQAEIYNIDLDHSSKVLSMQEDDTEVQEAVEVVTTAKLITEVVTAAATQVIAASIHISAAKPKVLKIAAASAVSTKKRKRVVIRDPEEELHIDTLAETLTVKDKGKGILIEDPKPMKKKDQIKMDAEYAKKLQEELDKEHEEAYKQIDWNAALDHVQAKEPQYIKRYHGIKKKPQSESEARKNMISYLKNTEGYKMEFFKGKTYDQIIPIFQSRFDANLKFLFKSREEMEKEDGEIIKSINETPTQKAAKRRKLSEEAQEADDLKKRLEIVQDEDDDVFVEATPLAQKVP